MITKEFIRDFLFQRKTVIRLLVPLFITFLMVVIPHFGFRPAAWVSPMPKQKNILKEVQPKLEIKVNDFKLKKQLITTVSAGSLYDQVPAYGVIDLETGQVLASKNLSEKMPMASLTKVMTAVVGLDLADPSEEFTVSPRAAAQIPTKVMLRAGERYALGNLLEHSLISSANDSTMVIKEGIDAKFGTEVFIKAMNLKAQLIGLKNTSFTNPAGLDSLNHYSSVEDLAILSAYALKNYPQIASIVSKEYEDLTQGGYDNRFYLNNWNGLLGVYPGASGVKIGNTSKAGHTTIVFAERGGKRILAVLLGAPGVLERDLWASELLDLGFSRVAGLPPVNVTEDQLREKYSSWKYFE